MVVTYSTSHNEANGWTCVLWANTVWKMPLRRSTSRIQTAIISMKVGPALINIEYHSIPQMSLSWQHWWCARLSRWPKILKILSVCLLSNRTHKFNPDQNRLSPSGCWNFYFPSVNLREWLKILSSNLKKYSIFISHWLIR